MTAMRFLITVDAKWSVTVTCEHAGQAWQWQRSAPLRRVPKDDNPRTVHFPLPPADELENLDGPHVELCKGDDLKLLQRAYDDVVLRKQADIERYGRYLFATLLGDELWKEINTRADAAHASVIELSLRWPGNAQDLHRHVWEMMHDGKRFLASGRPRLVAITRRVAGSRSDPPRLLMVPPRVLFVIGAKLDDPHIRPGAECLGLLRQIRSQNSMRAIHTRILYANPERPDRKVTPSYLRGVVRDFQPDVVHFICHGGFDSVRQQGYLELDLEAAEQSNKRFADKLLECLGVGEPFLPPMVVLSACYSSAVGPGVANGPTMLKPAHAAPLAAELVAGGVDVVIAMAGRVADSACRLFTRRVGSALVDGSSLTVATAQGRLAAFVERARPDRSVDWAFPSVFLAEGVPEDYVPVNGADAAWELENRIRGYNLLQSPPVFCGREDFFEDYYDLFRPGARRVLVIFTNVDTKGVGRTRLLHELVAQAIRDGDVPCLVRPGSGVLDGQDRPASSAKNPLRRVYPKNAVQFGGAVLRAIVGARKVFGLKIPLDGSLLSALEAEDGLVPRLKEWRALYAHDPAQLYVRVCKHCEGLDKNTLEAELVREALQSDLLQLRSDAWAHAAAELALCPDPVPPEHRARHGHLTRRAHGRVVVFLENVEWYGEALTTDLLNTILGETGSAGLGRATPGVDEAVPVVMTFIRAGAPAEIGPVLDDAGTRILWLRELKPFETENGEEARACERVLLYPSRETAALSPGVSDIAWAFNDRAQAGAVATGRMMFKLVLNGLPINFRERSFYEVARAAAIQGQGEESYLLEANDERLLSEILRTQEGPGGGGA